MRNQLQRRGLVYRQPLLCDGKIQADADHNGDAILATRNRHHFGEHATKFLSIHENIVRPFQCNIPDILVKAAAAIAYRTNNRLTHLAAGDHLQPTIDGRIAHNRNGHAYHQRHDERLPRNARPRMVETPAACRLLIRRNDHDFMPAPRGLPCIHAIRAAHAIRTIHTEQHSLAHQIRGIRIRGSHGVEQQHLIRHSTSTRHNHCRIQNRHHYSLSTVACSTQRNSQRNNHAAAIRPAALGWPHVR